MHEWDENKNIANLTKHSVSFEDAKNIFLDPNAIELFDELHSTQTENRYIVIGDVGGFVILTVVYTDRNGRVRIISARKASPTERSLYYGNIKKKT